VRGAAGNSRSYRDQVLSSSEAFQFSVL